MTIKNSRKRNTNAPLGPFPPHAQFTDFLPEADHRALLAYAIAQENSFKPATVYSGEGGGQTKYDPTTRQALKLRSLGIFEALVRERLLDVLPSITDASGYHGPEPKSIEFELNAYGDGAHFRPHIDIPIGPGRKPLSKEEGEDRVVSAVYYFHQEPKGFSGGELRIYRFLADASDEAAKINNSNALMPIQNSLVVFPSWATHEVERVSCPSGIFADYRFALNCWFCRRLAD